MDQSPFLPARQVGWGTWLGEKAAWVRNFITAARAERVLAKATDVSAYLMLAGCVASSVYLFAWGEKGRRCVPRSQAMDATVVEVFLAGIPLFGAFIPITCFCFLHNNEEDQPLCMASTVTMLQMVVMLFLTGWASYCFSTITGKVVLISMIIVVVLVVLLWGVLARGCMERARTLWRRQ